MTEGSKFKQKLAERRTAEPEGGVKSPSGVEDDVDGDLIPESEIALRPDQIELDRAIDSIDIIDAYRRWCGKMTPKVLRGQRESVMISCPVPGHVDANPSAWINLEKQVWYCAKCEQGGDAHDIAAHFFGYPVPGYKSGEMFAQLREKMAESMGIRIVKLPGGVVDVITPELEDDEVTEVVTLEVAPVPDTVDTPAPETLEKPAKAKLASITELPTSDDGEPIVFPKLAWRTVLPPGESFLRTYMEQTIQDDVPEEYHFWNALLALGFACGRKVRLWDLVPVYGNLFVCTLGPSGSGKSKARYHLDKLLTTAMPYSYTDPDSRGVKKISAPGSAEVLIHSFQKPVTDPADPKKVLYFAPVSGIIDFNELSALLGRANRMGNALKPAMMQFYDMEDVVSTVSLSTGVKEAHSPFASALTTSQPHALRHLLTRQDDSSGFLNRWVFVAGPEKKRIAVGGARVDMTPAVKPLWEIIAWSGVFEDDDFVNWSEESIAEFTKFFDFTIRPTQRASESAMLTRIDLLFKKIILLLCANEKAHTVTVDIVRRAASLYKYIIDCYQIVDGEIGTTFVQEVADAILASAKRRFEKDGKGHTLRDLARSLAKRRYPPDLLLKTCDALTKLGLLEAQTFGSTTAGGRPTVRYKYVG